MERFLYFQFRSIHLVFEICCIKYSIQVVDGGILWKKNLFLASIGLAWVVFCSWTLCECLLSISWLWIGSSTNIRILVSNYLLISWPREIPMFWTAFSHVVRMLSAEFFYPHVNMELPRALDRTEFAFSLLKLACWTLPEYLTLNILEIMPLSRASAPSRASSTSTHGGRLLSILSTLFYSRSNIPEPSMSVILLTWLESLGNHVACQWLNPCITLLIIVKRYLRTRIS